jgi:hypothetical protein
MIKSIFITAFKRNKIFFTTLRKLTKCKNYDQFKKLIIYQDINQNILNKIKKIDSEIEVINTNYTKNTSGIHKCNSNTYIGFKKCFEDYKSDYVIFLEDDILPAYDFLEFHDNLILHYRHDEKFFAVNSFSKEYIKYNTNSDFEYSKFIFGIGKGWSVPKERWKTLKQMWKELFYSKINEFYDCFFEFKIKFKYYVIMPYRSRVYDQPSNGLNTSFTLERKNQFNKSWKKSFLKQIRYETKNYIFNSKMNYSWRNDCLRYSKFNMLRTRYIFYLNKVKTIIKNIIY